MIMTFDKGTETERVIMLNSINAQPFSDTLFGSYSAAIENMPDLSPFEAFYGTEFFDTLDVETERNGVSIPVSVPGEYNHISSLRVQYDDMTGIYSVNIALNYVEPA